MLRILAALLFPAILLAAPPDAGGPGKALEETRLEHPFQVTAGLYSGGSPLDDAAFDALVKIGVKVVISVDGAAPKLEEAKKRGLRYIHLPIGYDGIPAPRVAELIKAAEEAQGPVYIHCHHGKHRGPAAAATICQALKGWDTAQAEAWLKQAGTGKEYAGLYRDVQGFKMPDAEARARVPASLPETTPPPPIVDRMVEIDDLFDALKAADARDWVQKPNQDPAAIATLLREQFRESARLSASAARGNDYIQLLEGAAENVRKLEHLFAKTDATIAEKREALGEITKDCANCHRSHRN